MLHTNCSLYNATERQEEKDDKSLVCDKHDRTITWEFCRGLPLTLIFSGVLQKRSV